MSTHIEQNQPMCMKQMLYYQLVFQKIMGFEIASVQYSASALILKCCHNLVVPV